MRNILHPPETSTDAAVVEAVHGQPPPLSAQALATRELSVLAVLILLGVVMLFTPARSAFYSERNLQNILLQVALLAIFAIGETIVIIAGGIDLSLGSLISLGIGGIHATLIHRLRLPAFVVTLVSLLVLRSQSLVMNHHQQIVIAPEKYPLFDWLANGKLPIFGWRPGAAGIAEPRFPIPVPAILLILIALATHVLLTRTRMGRYLYSVGSNEQATLLSGVNIFYVKLFAYGASALLGGVAGILWA